MSWPKHVVIDGVDMVCYPTRCYHPLPPGFGWAVLAAMAIGALISFAFMAFTVWQFNRQDRRRDSDTHRMAETEGLGGEA